MKKTLAVLLVICMVLLTACRRVETVTVGDTYAGLSRMTSLEKEYYLRAMKDYFDVNDEFILGKMMMPSGGVFCAHAFSEPHPKYTAGKEYVYIDFHVLDYEISQADRIFEAVHYPYMYIPSEDPESVCIFYPKNWDSFNPARPDIFVSADSYFVWHEGRLGRDALIFISPNVQYPCVPYEESEWYEQVPRDSLGSEPLMIQHPRWRDNYPVWVFAIPEDRIDESYELHYVDYVLNGSDLLNNTWQNGDAPIKPPFWWE